MINYKKNKNIEINLQKLKNKEKKKIYNITLNCE